MSAKRQIGRESVTTVARKGILGKIALSQMLLVKRAVPGVTKEGIFVLPKTSLGIPGIEIEVAGAIVDGPVQDPGVPVQAAGLGLGPQLGGPRNIGLPGPATVGGGLPLRVGPHGQNQEGLPIQDPGRGAGETAGSVTARKLPPKGPSPRRIPKSNLF